MKTSFQKDSIMLKGQSPKLKGALRNVPIHVVDICYTLPRPADSNSIVVLKFQKKLQYRGHIYFESVKPDIFFRLLHYLKLNIHCIITLMRKILFLKIF